jgi:uncharacterized protein (DUF433 family)
MPYASPIRQYVVFLQVTASERHPNNRVSDTIPSMIDWSHCPAVERDTERLSGAWVFRGTRVPVAALFENLEEDAPIHQFIEWFPGVTLAQAKSVLEYAVLSTLEPA